MRSTYMVATVLLCKITKLSSFAFSISIAHWQSHCLAVSKVIHHFPHWFHFPTIYEIISPTEIFSHVTASFRTLPCRSILRMGANVVFPWNTNNRSHFRRMHRTPSDIYFHSRNFLLTGYCWHFRGQFQGTEWTQL